MVDLNKILRDQFEDFDITPQHLGQILRDNIIILKWTKLITKNIISTKKFSITKNYIVF